MRSRNARTNRMNSVKLIEPSTVRLLGWDELRSKGIKDSKPTIYRKIKAEKFPAPVYPGKSPAWPEHEIDAYILGLIAKRDGGASDGRPRSNHRSGWSLVF